MTTIPLDEALDRAADHLVIVGHNRDGHYFRDNTSDEYETAPACVYGALAVVAQINAQCMKEGRVQIPVEATYPELHSLLQKTIRSLHPTSQTLSVTSWNDNEATEDDAIDLLRHAAKIVREESKTS